MTSDPSGGWKHTASGIVFPAEVAGFVRQSAAPAPTREGVLVDYRFTSKVTDTIEGYVNVDVAVIPAGSMSLKTAFDSRLAQALRFKWIGAKPVETGEKPAAGQLGPGMYAHYTIQASNIAGHNEDGDLQLWVHKRGNYYLAFSSSTAMNRRDIAEPVVAAFIRHFE